MPDTIAIHGDGEGVQVWFRVGCWWPLLHMNGRVRTWPSAEAAREWLRQAAVTYRWDYNEPLGWDVDAIPVLDGGNRHEK